MINTSSVAETFGLPINEAVAFSNPKGVFKERLKKKQLKMFSPLVPLLKQFLEPGEEIQLVMSGCSPMTFMEQFTTGWIIYYIKRCILVVTDRRILHFPTRTNFSPRHSISQIRFGDVEAIKPSVFLGNKLQVKYKNGSKETFLYVKDAAKFKAVLKGLQMKGHQPSTVGIRHHLCPKCTALLKAGKYLCASCKLEFKNAQRARKLSILIPGGGYFYTGHPILGAGDAIVETLLLLIVLSSIVTGSPLAEVLIFSVLLFAEKLYTIYHAQHYVKEFIPVDKEFQPIRR